MGKVPMQVVKEFEHQAWQNLYTLNFLAAFNHIISECNLIMENCSDSLKVASKLVKTRIQKVPIPKGQSETVIKRPVTT